METGSSMPLPVHVSLSASWGLVWRLEVYHMKWFITWSNLCLGLARESLVEEIVPCLPRGSMMLRVYFLSGITLLNVTAFPFWVCISPGNNSQRQILTPRCCLKLVPEIE